MNRWTGNHHGGFITASTIFVVTLTLALGAAWVPVSATVQEDKSGELQVGGSGPVAVDQVPDKASQDNGLDFLKSFQVIDNCQANSHLEGSSQASQDGAVVGSPRVTDSGVVPGEELPEFTKPGACGEDEEGLSGPQPAGEYKVDPSELPEEAKVKDRPATSLSDELLGTSTMWGVWWTGVVDMDSDGYKQYARLTYDIDVSSCTGSIQVYEKIYWQRPGESTWHFFLTTSSHTITGCSGNDVRSVGVCGGGHSTYDWRIDVYLSGQGSPDLQWGPSNDSDINDYPMETSAEDGGYMTAVFDAWWSNTVDSDGDGCFEEARLNYDIDVVCCDGSASVYEKIYYKLSSSSSWTLLFTTTSHVLTQCATSDARYVTINGANGVHDFRIDVFKTGHGTYDDSYGAGDDPSLDNVCMEPGNNAYACVDDFWVTSTTDIDGDGCYSAATICYDIDVCGAAVPLSIYEKVYYSTNNGASWYLLTQTSTRVITGTTSSDSRCVALTPSGTCQCVDYKVVVYQSGSGSPDDDEQLEVCTEGEDDTQIVCIDNAWWSNHRDLDGDGCSDQRYLNYDLDVCDCSGLESVYIKLWYKRYHHSSYSLLVTTPSFSISNCSGTDAHYTIVNGSLDTCTMYDFRIEAFRVGEASPDDTKDESNSGILNNQGFDDELTSVDSAHVASCHWTNVVDADNDGCSESARFLYDIDVLDCTGSITAYEKIYYKPTTSSVWSLYTTTSTHTVTGCTTSDTRYVTVDGLDYNNYNFRVYVYRSGQSGADDYCSAASRCFEDPVPPDSACVASCYWTNVIDEDNDGCAESARFNYNVDVCDCSGSVTAYEKVYYKPTTSSTWTWFQTTSDHTVTGCTNSDTRYVTVSGFDHNDYDFRVYVYRSGQSGADDYCSSTRCIEYQHNELDSICVKNCYFSHVVDADNDDCIESMRLNYDVDVCDCDGTVVVYEQLYWKPTWTYSTPVLLDTKPAHTITGCNTSGSNYFQIDQGYDSDITFFVRAFLLQDTTIQAQCLKDTCMEVHGQSDTCLYPVEQTGKPYTVVVQSAAYNGGTLPIGSEIGLYDGNLCVGMKEVTNFPVTITAWEQDAGSGLQGFVSGHDIDLKYCVGGAVHEACIDNVTQGDGKFGFAPFTVLTATDDCGTDTVCVHIDGGKWDWISFCKMPLDPSAHGVFDSANCLQQAIDHDGLTFIPPYNVDNIGTIDMRKGYAVFSDCDEDYCLPASEINPCIQDYQISLVRNRWSWIPFLCCECASVTQVLSSIQGSIAQVIAVDGRTWIPDLNVNTLGQLCPGKAYRIFIKPGAGTVSFNYCCNQWTSERGSDWIGSSVDSKGDPVYFQPVPSTGKPYTVIVDLTDEVFEDGSAPEHGDEIGVYDGLTCVGAAVFEGDAVIAITAWERDDGYNLDGFTRGRPITVRYFDQSEQLERRCQPLPQSDGSSEFGGATYSVFKVEISSDAPRSAGQMLPTQFSLNQNYPNPFNPITTIGFSLPRAALVSLDIFNITGQKVITLANRRFVAGVHEVVWNGRDHRGSEVSSGVYYYRLEAGDMIETRKMMLLK